MGWVQGSQMGKAGRRRRQQEGMTGHARTLDHILRHECVWYLLLVLPGLTQLGPLVADGVVRCHLAAELSAMR